jgi:hypothetical protein
MITRINARGLRLSVNAFLIDGLTIVPSGRLYAGFSILLPHLMHRCVRLKCFYSGDSFGPRFQASIETGNGLPFGCNSPMRASRLCHVSSPLWLRTRLM